MSTYSALEQLNFDLLYESVDIEATVKQHTEFDLQRSHQLRELGMAALIQDGTGGVLVFEHEARGGEFKQRAIGPPTEKLRRLTRKPGYAESPMHAFMRVLLEEVPDMSIERIEHAGLYFDGRSFIEPGEWVLGEKNGVTQYIAGCTIGVSIEHPEVLTNTSNRTEEVLGLGFKHIDDVLRSDNLRPGAEAWFRAMRDHVGPRDPGHDEMPVVLPDLVSTGDDVVFM